MAHRGESVGHHLGRRAANDAPRGGVDPRVGEQLERVVHLGAVVGVHALPKRVRARARAAHHLGGAAVGQGVQGGRVGAHGEDSGSVLVVVLNVVVEGSGRVLVVVLKVVVVLAGLLIALKRVLGLHDLAVVRVLVVHRVLALAAVPLLHHVLRIQQPLRVGHGPCPAHHWHVVVVRIAHSDGGQAACHMRGRRNAMHQLLGGEGAR